MLDLSCDLGEKDVIDETGMLIHGTAEEDYSRNAELHQSDDDELNTEALEIRVPPELKPKFVRRWQTSIILKLMGRPLGY